ncbi:MAG: hypothetical protein U9R44_03925, partial [Candidatus Omnitrophota bacterium]|nr:hypothetical protein [Candidatus Omnitrophota bacterium]
MVRKLRKKGYFGIAAFILVVTFSSLTVSTSYPVMWTGVTAGINLLPQLRSKPVQDAEIADKHMLETFLQYKIRQDPGIFTDLTGKIDDLYSDLGPKKVVVNFTKAERFRAEGSTAGSADMVRVIPCSIDAQQYYIYVISGEENCLRIGVDTQSEYIDHFEEMARKGYLQVRVVERLRKRLFLDDFPLTVVDRTDEAVKLALEFLEKIGAARIAKKLETIVAEGKLVVTKGTALAVGAIVIDDVKNESERA